MKSFFYITSILVFYMTSCQNSVEDYTPVSTDIVNNPITASSEQSNTDIPEIEFSVKEYDFGEIIQGEKVTYSFTFKSNGDGPLVISDVSSTCGCTVPSWPTSPIEPGKTGDIVVIFDSDGKRGKVVKEISVLTNAVPSTRILTIKADINSLENN